MHAHSHTQTHTHTHKHRSPLAYNANPARERALYKHNTEKKMTLLRIRDADSSEGRGLVSWFAVHPVSMNNTNPYLSGDNKGAAEQFTEKWAEGREGMAPRFVAAFAQNNGADTTPNTYGAFCLDSGAWGGAAPRGG